MIQKLAKVAYDRNIKYLSILIRISKSYVRRDNPRRDEERGEKIIVLIVFLRESEALSLLS